MTPRPGPYTVDCNGDADLPSWSVYHGVELVLRCGEGEEGEKRANSMRALLNSAWRRGLADAQSTFRSALGLYENPDGTTSVYR